MCVDPSASALVDLLQKLLPGKIKSVNVLGSMGCTRVPLLSFIFVLFRAHSTFPEPSSCKAHADTRWLYAPVLDDRVRIRVPGKSWGLGVMALALEGKDSCLFPEMSSQTSLTVGDIPIPSDFHTLST